MSPMRPLTYGSPVTPRNTANISRPSEELLPVRFPLGKTGGLIEANWDAVEAYQLRGFRWVKPAASLKPCKSTSTVASCLGFRWVKPAASLKLGAYGSASGFVDDGFRWVKPAASLKLRHQHRRRVGLVRGFRWVKPAASLKRRSS